MVNLDTNEMSSRRLWGKVHKWGEESIREMWHDRFRDT